MTGADSGIGRRVAALLAEDGHVVVPVCLREANGRALVEEVGGDVRPEICDFSELDQVRRLADRLAAAHPEIQALVNVAGIVTSSYGETRDGFERQLGVNHLAPYLLTRSLVPCMVAGAPSRIVIVASRAHRYIRLNKHDPNLRQSYNGLLAYRQSKLFNVLFALDLARRLDGTGVTVTSQYPGVTRSQIATANTTGWLHAGGRILQLFSRPTDRSARDIVALAVGEAWEGITGAYVSKSRQVDPASHAQDVDDQRWAWEWSADAVGLPR